MNNVSQVHFYIKWHHRTVSVTLVGCTSKRMHLRNHTPSQGFWRCINGCSKIQNKTGHLRLISLSNFSQVAKEHRSQLCATMIWLDSVACGRSEHAHTHTRTHNPHPHTAATYFRGITRRHKSALVGIRPHLTARQFHKRLFFLLLTFHTQKPTLLQKEERRKKKLSVCSKAMCHDMADKTTNQGLTLKTLSTQC